MGRFRTFMVLFGHAQRHSERVRLFIADGDAALSGFRGAGDEQAGVGGRDGIPAAGAGRGDFLVRGLSRGVRHHPFVVIVAGGVGIVGVEVEVHAGVAEVFFLPPA